MLILLALSIVGFSQSFQPVLGINYTGGFTYKMDQELFSGKVGMLYTPKNKKSFVKTVELSGNYYYSPLSKIPGSYSFYNLKVQMAKQVLEYWNVVFYGGYINNFENDIMRPYNGEFKTNLSYGVGIQTFDDRIMGEVLFEQLAGYPHLSVGVTYKFKKINKTKDENLIK
ncbi:hypothetical protein L0B70_00485 [Kaistella sp. 97-N-M2]|uniref:hypothetical protein n=1 Tax=Kaistella sp. 97-N-M2 TaxID=2908645 RepID=UPI001F15B04B|nr:hypothetical protein [Kaistella sp. 97-N-M2]UJF29905.1 hypothetical protein L0B70_00485 [Kaistella sp. 97-N-M2]